ncbi:DUF305 domain-containing protein [Micromonospora aurantiaca]|jgi:hypothetical protein|uniref:DUF305 domain-containing protein n=1 Tax=Micromonospora aurantiaca (nom. illeg.) TaxID=47850 RepID=A0A1C6TNH6_9ACTN|nr:MULTISPECIES: DUF305 domain-containing protein [Micromonospora]ADU09719.1 protein of unknown function DUF305 [Micromonospora sp. L5]AXH93648.1 DUF305 domain-containing protein [Micromonospora aurantiaca]KAB1118654.1 DUF305 domain-containing protein [Micromonospora aurantiaca]MBC8990219.1 DUF305 domain-containing protein [Micromonospora chalcea]MBC9003223.1 DUF305 domain-containing protein [Micromonospora aurantiaca]
MKQNYVRFGVVLAVSLVVMFVLTLSQIRRFGDFYLNLSNFYMSLIMVSIMGVIMMGVMSSMFTNKRLNIMLYIAFAAVFIGGFAAVRTEPFVGNEGFLKSMIPHHSRAVLVCQESDITDPEIIELCDQIVKSQEEEITQMKKILKDRY